MCTPSVQPSSNRHRLEDTHIFVPRSSEEVLEQQWPEVCLKLFYVLIISAAHVRLKIICV